MTHYTKCYICQQVECNNPSCKCHTCVETKTQELVPENVGFDFCNSCSNKMVSYFESQFKRKELPTKRLHTEEDGG